MKSKLLDFPPPGHTEFYSYGVYSTDLNLEIQKPKTREMSLYQFEPSWIGIRVSVASIIKIIVIIKRKRKPFPLFHFFLIVEKDSRATNLFAVLSALRRKNSETLWVR